MTTPPGSTGVAEPRRFPTRVVGPTPTEADVDGGGAGRPRHPRDRRRQPEPDPAGVGSMMKLLRFGVVGVLLVVVSLAWDVYIHLEDPLAAHEESGPFDPSNPAHVMWVMGGMIVVGSLVGAMVRGQLVVGRHHRPRRTALVLALSLVLAGGGAYALAGAGDGGPALLPDDPQAAESHPHGLVNSHAEGPCDPSRADRLGALQLISDTAKGTARFADSDVALAEGYVPGFAAATSDHWLNPFLMGDGNAFDPTRPEALIYTQTSRGPVLTGVTYIMDVAGEFGPEVGGCLTRWHVHANLCFSPVTQALVGEVGADGVCPPGGVRYVPPPALHVWLVDVPDGRFGAGIDHEALLAAVRP